MKIKSDPSLYLAQKYQRLDCWKKLLKGIPDAEDPLNTYSLLVSKVQKDPNDFDSQKRLGELERKISDIFDSTRLMTSTIGRASIRHLAAK